MKLYLNSKQNEANKRLTLYNKLYHFKSQIYPFLDLQKWSNKIVFVYLPI